MASRRQDAATALTGAALLGAGGGLRHAGVSQAVGSGQFPRIHLSALKGAKRGPKGLYLAGTGLGLVGTAALSQGAFGLARHRKVAKAEKKPLWQEGIAGTGEALRGRADSIKTPTPTKVRASQWAIAGGAGAGGSAVARALLKHRTGKAKALLAPIAGGLAATASIPVSNRVVRRQTKGQYVVTPTGVRRAKDIIKKPSSKAHMVSSRSGPMRGQVVPSDNRFGKSTSYRQQRAAITAAGATPVVGPFAQAHLAGSYAPPGQRGKNAVRQFAMGPAAGMAAGIGGAYGGAALAHRVASVGDKAESAMAWRSSKTNALRGKVGLGPAKPAAEGTVRHAVRAAAEAHPLAKPLVRSRGTMAAAGLGFLASRAVASTVGGQHAITLNQRDQSRARVGKALLESGQTKREKHTLARTKRTNAALAVTSGSLGLGSLGLLAARKKSLATSMGIVASGVGGTNSLIGARVQRREARNIDPVKKAWMPKSLLKEVKYGPKLMGRRTEGFLVSGTHSRATEMRAYNKTAQRGSDATDTVMRTKPGMFNVGGRLSKGYLPELPYNGPKQVWHKTLGRLTVQAYHGNGRFTVQSKSGTRLMHRDHIWPKDVGKAFGGRKFPHVPASQRKPKPNDGRSALNDALERLRAEGKMPSKPVQKDVGADHRDLLRRYGDRGPLPKGLQRDEKMRAYEARYAAHGGKKGEKWQRRANVAEGARNVALGTGTVALAGLAHLKTKRGGRMAIKHPRLHNRLDHLALASGAAGGAAELSGEIARDRRASYASSPGGVAASALTRMKANTPGAT